jgi:hypothetical protein
VSALLLVSWALSMLMRISFRLRRCHTPSESKPNDKSSSPRSLLELLRRATLMLPSISQTSASPFFPTPLFHVNQVIRKVLADIVTLCSADPGRKNPSSRPSSSSSSPACSRPTLKPKKKARPPRKSRSVPFTRPRDSSGPSSSSLLVRHPFSSVSTVCRRLARWYIKADTALLLTYIE